MINNWLLFQKHGLVNNHFLSWLCSICLLVYIDSNIVEWLSPVQWESSGSTSLSCHILLSSSQRRDTRPSATDSSKDDTFNESGIASFPYQVFVLFKFLQIHRSGSVSPGHFLGYMIPFDLHTFLKFFVLFFYQSFLTFPFDNPACSL